MVTVIPKGKLEIKEGDAPFTLFSQRKVVVVIAAVPLSSEVWISPPFAFTST